MNKIMIIGNVGNNPSIKEFQSGSRSVMFDVGVHENVNDKEGNKVRSTEWFKCIAWNKTVDFIEKYVEKGSKVFVEGKFRSRTYIGHDGIEAKTYELLVEKFELLTWAEKPQ